MPASIHQKLSIGECDTSIYRKGWISPGKEVFPGLKFSYAHEQFDEDPELSHRLESAPDGTPRGTHYLVADARNQSGHWFSLDLNIAARVSHCVVRLKGYPVRRVYPKLYFDAPKGGMTGPVHSQCQDLPDVAIFEEFSSIRIDIPPLPEGARNVRLALNVPDEDWFVLGFESMKAYASA